MCRVQVVATLKDLASSGHTVVCSIHQPRSSIFGMFDDLMLLSEGRCVYFGPAEGVLDYFEKVGPQLEDHRGVDRVSLDSVQILRRWHCALLASASCMSGL